MDKEKVLVIRKPDRTIHQVPIGNKATLMALSNRMPPEHQWSFEEMDEKDAAKLPFIDRDYVRPSEANEKLKEQDKKIRDLEAQLAALSNNLPPENAVDKIARINAAESADAVIAILANDERKTVKDAAEKMIASFSK